MQASVVERRVERHKRKLPPDNADTANPVRDLPPAFREAALGADHALRRNALELEQSDRDVPRDRKMSDVEDKGIWRMHVWLLSLLVVAPVAPRASACPHPAPRIRPLQARHQPNLLGMVPDNAISSLNDERDERAVRVQPRHPRHGYLSDEHETLRDIVGAQIPNALHVVYVSHLTRRANALHNPPGEQRIPQCVRPPFRKRQQGMRGRRRKPRPHQQRGTERARAALAPTAVHGDHVLRVHVQKRRCLFAEADERLEGGDIVVAVRHLDHLVIEKAEVVVSVGELLERLAQVHHFEPAVVARREEASNLADVVAVRRPRHARQRRRQHPVRDVGEVEVEAMIHEPAFRPRDRQLHVPSDLVLQREHLEGSHDGAGKVDSHVQPRIDEVPRRLVKARGVLVVRKAVGNVVD
mmetsp:Transcript_9140/g.21451  ORF Transcript_9140/g.21451 Transcript_9140/m.21451 type:complete len:412 (-) Transcript_9140:481-1716(-)